MDTSDTKYAQVNGVKIAYRSLGQLSQVPLVMCMHYRGNMDFWDPLLLTNLSSNRQVIIFDNAGVGRSEGEVPLTIKGWADWAIGLIQSLGLDKIDLLGFSMGGATAQMVALNAPGLVRKLILCGTRASQGPTSTDPIPKYRKILTAATNMKEAEVALTETFFQDTDIGRKAAKEYWQRLDGWKGERVGILNEWSTKRQLEAILEWAVPNPSNSYDRIHELTMPVFVANGDDDYLIPTHNSWDLMTRLPDAHLHIYPGAGHGFLYQYAELFAKHVSLFLDCDKLLQNSVLRSSL